MNAGRHIKLSHLLVLSLILIGVGCRTTKASKSTEPPLPSPPPINTIRIGDFKCDNAVTAQAVHNVFVEVLGRNRFVKLVRDGEADVVIEGTVTYAQAGSYGSTAAKSSAVAGEYVSGVTSIAYRNGEILTSASWGQVMAKGGEILPPEFVARKTADKLMGLLYRHGLRQR